MSTLVPIVAAGLLAAAAIAGCSTSDDSTPALACPTSATSGTGGAGGVGGAGGDGPSAYPAPHHALPEMIFLGGSVIASPKLVTLTFAGDPNRDAYRAFDDFIVTSKWWTAVTEGYAIGAGTSEPPVEAPDTLSGKTLDSDQDLKPLLLSLISQAVLPPPDANTLYVIYLPENVVLTAPGGTLCQGLYGYHDFLSPSQTGGAATAFAVVPKCKTGAFTGNASHEVIEALTDPAFTGYYLIADAWTASAGGESADVCSRMDRWSEGGFDLARSWTNASVQRGSWPCQPVDPAQPFFAAVPDTELQFNSNVQALSDGYLVVKRGETRSFNVDVFSEAELAHEVDLYVGVQAAQQPGEVDPITAGVTSTLSPTKGTNGTRTTLTIAVAPDAHAGDFHFQIQAVLDSTTYTWIPAILRIE